MLANRLKKRLRHLRKWARRNNITCYRLYEKDIPEYPLIVDWYDGEVVVWLYQRKRDETRAQAKAWKRHALAEIREGIGLLRQQVFVKERRRQRGTFQYERIEQQDHVRIVQEQGLNFEVNLSGYLDTGLFLDHRNTRNLVRTLAQGKRVLNLFAYTGSFTCYAIDGGARATTTVDLSQTYCEWAKRNLAHNHFQENPRHRIIQKDCLDFLKSEIESGHGYDLIICDPPTFSTSKRMQQSSFSVERDHVRLLMDCSHILNEGGEIIFSTNAQRFKIDVATLANSFCIEENSEHSVPEDFRNKGIHRCWRLRNL